MKYIYNNDNLLLFINFPYNGSTKQPKNNKIINKLYVNTFFFFFFFFFF